MLRRKISETEKRGAEEEKYQFMREQIRPQRKRIFMVFLRKIIGTMILAVVFGALAGVSFTIVRNLLEDDRLTQAREAILQSTADHSVSQGLTKNNEGNVQTGESLEEYKTFWEKVSAVGRYCNQFIVEVQGTQDGSWFQKCERSEDIQTGVIFRESKKCYYILTPAYHLAKTKPVEVELSTDEVAAAEVLGVDHTLGIAVLEVKKENISEKTKNKIQVAGFGSEADLEIGSPVIAVGSPNGVMKSVISGNIVNNNLTSAVTDGEITLYSFDVEYCKDGNGFVTNMQGEIVGMISNSFIDITGETDCAFIGISKIRKLTQYLINGKEMVYFGVTGCNWTGEKEDLNAEGAGVYVTNVILRSPAYQGEIRVADVITEIDGCKIRNLQEMQECLLTYEPGDTIIVTISRKAEEEQDEKKMKVVLQ